MSNQRHTQIYKLSQKFLHLSTALIHVLAMVKDHRTLDKINISTGIIWNSVTFPPNKRVYFDQSFEVTIYVNTRTVDQKTQSYFSKTYIYHHFSDKILLDFWQKQMCTNKDKEREKNIIWSDMIIYHEGWSFPVVALYYSYKAII